MLLGRILLSFSFASLTYGLLSCSSKKSRSATIIYGSHTWLTCVNGFEEVQGCLVRHKLDENMTSVVVNLAALTTILSQLRQAYQTLNDKDFTFSGDEKYVSCKLIQDAIATNVSAFLPIEADLYKYVELTKLLAAAQANESTSSETKKPSQGSMIREILSKKQAQEESKENDDDDDDLDIMKSRSENDLNANFAHNYDDVDDLYSYFSDYKEFAPNPLPAISEIPLCNMKSKSDGDTYLVHTDLSLHRCNNESWFDFVTCSNTTHPSETLRCIENGGEEYLFNKWTARDPCHEIVGNISLPIRMHDCLEEPYDYDDYENMIEDF